MITYYNQPDFYDYSYFYTETLVFFIIVWLIFFSFLAALIKLGKYSYNRKKKIYYFFSLIAFSGLLYQSYKWSLTPSKYWYEGVNGLKLLDKDPEGK